MIKTDGTADCVVRICSSKRDVIDIKIHRVPPEKKVCAHSSDFLQCVSIETQKMKTAAYFKITCILNRLLYNCKYD